MLPHAAPLLRENDVIDLGPHTAFIVASYGAVIGILAALILWLMIDGRQQAKALTDLEARGTRRRSAKAAP